MRTPLVIFFLGKMTKYDERNTQLLVQYNDALPVDIECPLRETHKVMQEPGGKFYNAMLNQTNIASNNNKYYILQARYKNPFFSTKTIFQG